MILLYHIFRVLSIYFCGVLWEVTHDEITADTASEKLPDKNKTVLLYCRTGRRSEIAAKTLIELGYTNVYDFGGITTDWTGEVVK